MLANSRAKTLEAFTKATTAGGAIVHTDGLNFYAGLAKLGFEHRPHKREPKLGLVRSEPVHQLGAVVAGEVPPGRADSRKWQMVPACDFDRRPLALSVCAPGASSPGSAGFRREGARMEARPGLVELQDLLDHLFRSR